ncbi:MAG: hypothetical protein K5883_07015 [Pseudobutyrivibrio sp.]|nr:hypothetical protein [Pseudobutyrivibrio sp.]
MKRKQVIALIASAAVVAGGVATGVYLNSKKDIEVETQEEIVETEPEDEVEQVEEEEVEEEHSPTAFVFSQAHVLGSEGSYEMDEELAEILMDMDIAEGATEEEVNWWLNQTDDKIFDKVYDNVAGKDNEQGAVFEEIRQQLLIDIGETHYRIHDEYAKAHQSSGSSSSSTQKPSNGSSNSSNNSSNGNGGSSSSNAGNSSSTPTPTPAPAPSGNSSSDSDYNPEFDDGAPNEQGTGNGGSSGNDFGGCITWR